MIIKLYTTSDTPNTINKTLNNEITLSGTIKDSSSILNPVITVRMNKSIISGFSNYMYIEEFKRYYFITDITVTDESYFVISASIDVLESYKNVILNSQQIISRQETAFNSYLPDNELATTNKTFRVVKEIPSVTKFVTDGTKIGVDDFYFTLTTVNNLSLFPSAKSADVKEGEL